jgi:acylglycerol lipase
MDLLEYAVLVAAVVLLLRVVMTWALAHVYDHAEARRTAFPPGRNNHPNLLAERTLADTSFRHEEGFLEGLWWQKLWRVGVKPKGVIVMFHGYADHCDFMQVTHAHELVARTGCVVFIFDQPGFGRSHGLWGFIPTWRAHVTECQRFVAKFVRPFAASLHAGCKVLGIGSSMGGGVLLTMAVHEPGLFDGLVLLAPMCKMAASLRPSYPVEVLLRLVVLVAPALPVTPTPELAGMCYRESEFAEVIMKKNHLNYKMKPRLATALSLVEGQDFISGNMEKVTTPFLVIHGTADLITNPASSKELHERSLAKDKSIELLKDYHHCLMGGGQSPAFCETPYSKIADWLAARL